MINFFDIKRQNKLLGNDLYKAINEVIDKGIFILGSKVVEFEKEFAKYLEVRYAVGVASGTDALSLGLLSLGVKKNDEVIMPANSYPTAFGITAIDAVPRLIDIDPGTFNIDPGKLSQAITKKTKAIVAVHLYGQPANMEEILKIGKKYNIPVVEDCAQAAGAEVKINRMRSRHARRSGRLKQSESPACAGRHDSPDGGGIWKKVGSIGDIGCFSFYPTKNLGAFGDGGMVVTNNKEIYEKVKMLRIYGEKNRYESVLLGRNSRLDELQAAILLVKLKHLDKWIKRRREIAYLYNLCKSTSCKWPYEDPNIKHVYHLFIIRTKNRDKLKIYLENKGIQTAIHYPVPIHMVPSMKFLGYKKGDFPESEKACDEILSLPMFPELADDEVKQVTGEIRNFGKNQYI